MPNFLLQPLVENAVRHGIAPHARLGRLTISACSAKATGWRCDIVDSGDGVPPHRLTLLNQGVGLANTRARLEHLYRSDHCAGVLERRRRLPRHRHAFRFTVDPRE